MGIRIHKKIGYGLDDVQYQDIKIVDQRFNLEDGYFAFDCEDQEEIFSGSKFFEHLEKRVENEQKEKNISMLLFDFCYLKDLNLKEFDFFDYITYDSEFGLKNVILFQTFSEDWTRYDNIIDYVEETENRQKNNYKILKRPIYPYENWINLKTGLDYLEVDGKRLRLVELLRAVNYFEEFVDIEVDEEYLKTFGFDSIEDVKNNIKPAVPEIIKEYCKWLKIFKDEKIVDTLKPMVYNYWS